MISTQVFVHTFTQFNAVLQIIRVIKGRGDVFDTSGRIASIKGAALNMATGQSSEGTVNLSQENEDLKVSVYLSHLSKL